MDEAKSHAVFGIGPLCRELRLFFFFKLGILSACEKSFLRKFSSLSRNLPSPSPDTTTAQGWAEGAKLGPPFPYND